MSPTPQNPTEKPAPSAAAVSTYTAAPVFEEAELENMPLPDEFFIKLLVSNTVAGSIIGRQGAAITTLMRTTGARVTLSPTSAYFPGTVDRVMAISGSRAAVLGVLDVTIDRIVSLSSAAPMSVILKIAAARAAVGLVIGRQGGFVQRIRDETNATVHISPLFVDPMAACAERVISVSNAPLNGLRHAIHLIVDRVQLHPETHRLRSVVYARQRRIQMGMQHNVLLPQHMNMVPSNVSYPVQHGHGHGHGHGQQGGGFMPSGNNGHFNQQQYR